MLSPIVGVGRPRERCGTQLFCLSCLVVSVGFVCCQVFQGILCFYLFFV